MAATATAGMTTEVDRNYEVFRELLPELLKTHAGKFAVMHNGEFITCLDTVGDALRFGDAKFGEGRFSIQEVTSRYLNLGFYSYGVYQLPN